MKLIVFSLYANGNYRSWKENYEFTKYICRTRRRIISSLIVCLIPLCLCTCILQSIELLSPTYQTPPNAIQSVYVKWNYSPESLDYTDITPWHAPKQLTTQLQPGLCHAHKHIQLISKKQQTTQNTAFV